MYGGQLKRYTGNSLRRMVHVAKRHLPRFQGSGPSGTPLFHIIPEQSTVVDGSRPLWSPGLSLAAFDRLDV